MDRVCGLDVYKDSVFMCILTANGEKIEDVFGTLTPEPDRLCDTLYLMVFDLSQTAN